MKKKLFSLLLIGITFLGVRHVNADTIELSHFYDQFPEAYEVMTTYNTQITNLISYWNNNYRTQSSQYIIWYTSEKLVAGGNTHHAIRLVPLTSPNVERYEACQYTCFRYDDIGFQIEYDIDSDSYDYNYTYTGSFVLTPPPLLASTNLVYIGSGNLEIPSYNDSNVSISSYIVEEYQYFPTVQKLVGGNFEPNPQASYTTIDLSSYEYVVLSLKSYNQSQFSSVIYVKGQLCLTPVYNYGMTERKQILEGTKVQSCSVETYIDYTAVPLYLTTQDIQNHAVYYINKPQNSLDNTIKVDTSVFNISYITQANVDNPSVIVNGRSYPIIPYSQLTDTAIISTNEGYISGISCSFGDINCMSQYSGISVDDLFSNPLKLLQSVWSAITSVLAVIGYFIGILPPMLQAFMFTAFILALVLGIIKIIL